MNLFTARKNYKKYGDSEKEMLQYVRKPKKNELSGID